MSIAHREIALTLVGISRLPLHRSFLIEKGKGADNIYPSLRWMETAQSLEIPHEGEDVENNENEAGWQASSLRRRGGNRCPLTIRIGGSSEGEGEIK